MLTNTDLTERINRLCESQQKQVSDFIDSITEYETDENEQNFGAEPTTEYQTKKVVVPELTPVDFQEQLYELTGRKDPHEAFTKLVQWYLRAELFRLEHQKKEYETKWKMTFEEFEKKSMFMPDADSMEMEELYFDWQGVITELLHINTILRKWK